MPHPLDKRVGMGLTLLSRPIWGAYYVGRRLKTYFYPTSQQQ